MIVVIWTYQTTSSGGVKTGVGSMLFAGYKFLPSLHFLTCSLVSLTYSKLCLYGALKRAQTFRRVSSVFMLLCQRHVQMSEATGVASVFTPLKCQYHEHHLGTYECTFSGITPDLLSQNLHLTRVSGAFHAHCSLEVLVSRASWRQSIVRVLG